MSETKASADLCRLVKMTKKLFDRWDITKEERHVLLLVDLSHLNDVLAGEVVCARREGVGQRCNQLLYIHRCLRLLFPENKELAYRWIKATNLAFDGRSPLQLMINEGVLGYERVIRYLDNSIAL